MIFVSIHIVREILFSATQEQNTESEVKKKAVIVHNR